MKLLNLVQGSDKWLEARLNYLCSSEAPVVMGESKFMSRTQLLDLKKGWQKNPDSAFKKRLFEKGHIHEDQARAHTELETLEDYPAAVGLLKVDGLDVEMLASFDGLENAEPGALIWEHKDWNLTLAENVRNGVLEPLYYWQLEHQCIVNSSDKVLFTCSDGTTDNRVSMVYESVPERREQLIKGWALFLEDLDKHELEAKKEKVVAVKQENFPVIECRVEGSKVISNLGSYIPLIEQLAEEQMNLSLETDQDFANKDAFNKRVKTGRAELKEKAADILANFDSLKVFNDHVATADGILQKLQAHGEKQVKQAKEVKKQSIINDATKELNDHLKWLSDGINNVQVPVRELDFAAIMKGKRSYEKMEEAVKSELANIKLEANDIAGTIRENLDSLAELAKDYKFLFNDYQDLITKDNGDLVNLIKMRISEHQQAEAERKRLEREQIEREAQEKAQREAEAKAKAEEQRIRDEERAKFEAEQAERKAVEEKRQKAKQEPVINTEEREALQEANSPLFGDKLKSDVFESKKSDGSSKRDLIISVVKDLASSFVYYDRKEDEDLQRGDIEKAIASGDISLDEIVQVFASELRNAILFKWRGNPPQHEKVIYEKRRYESKQSS